MDIHHLYQKAAMPFMIWTSEGVWPLVTSMVSFLVRFLCYLCSAEISYFSCASCTHILVFSAGIYSFYSILIQIKCFSHTSVKFGAITWLHKRQKSSSTRNHCFKTGAFFVIFEILQTEQYLFKLHYKWYCTSGSGELDK